jgi:hypothetical protein
VGGAVLASYVAVVVWLTWPLASQAEAHHALTQFSAFTDVLLIAWAATYETWALVSGLAPQPGIYHPTPHSLYYGEAGFGVLPLFAPVFLATQNAILATNVAFLGGVALTAASIHGVTRYWSGSHLGGIVAATVFLATPFVLWSWIPTAPNYAILFYIPIIMVLAAGVTASWWRTIGLGLLVALQGLSTVYVAFATCVPLTVLAAVRLLRRDTRVAGLHLVASLAMGVLLLVPPYWGYIQVQRENPRLRDQSMYRMQATARSILPRQIIDVMSPTAVPLITLPIVLAGFLCRRRRAHGTDDESRRREGWRHAAFWAIVGLYFSFKPLVVIAGTRMRLPHAPLKPVYAALRASDRLGVTALIAVSVLAGIAVVECLALVRGRRASFLRIAGTAVVVGLLLTGYFRPIKLPGYTTDPAAPYPLIGVPELEDPSVYETIALSSGALLELPVGPGSKDHAFAMYRALRHRRPLLNGYSGYYPAEFPARMALACRLPDPEALATLVRETGLELILVHTRWLVQAREARSYVPYRCEPFPAPEPDVPPGAEVQAWLDAAIPGRRADLRLVHRGVSGDLLFRVEKTATQ